MTNFIFSHILLSKLNLIGGNGYMDNKLCANAKNQNKCKDDECCIDTYRIFDSCRYQDCLNHLRIFLCGDGQSVVDQAVNVRVKSVKVVWTKIRSEEIVFNRGYFEVNIRYYFYVVLECCCQNGSVTEVQGIALADKTVALYGGQSNVTTFQSDVASCFCPVDECVPIHGTSCLPRVVVDVVDPVSLKLICVDGSCSSYDDPQINLSSIPAEITNYFENSFCDYCGGKKLYITIGMFAVIRMERPAQLAVPACDYCIPDEPCDVICQPEDPCALFCNLEFPLREFYPASNPCPGAGSFDVRNSEVNVRIR